MKEIVVISGKGGTGKTSIAAAFSQIEGSGMLVADCDVDAANMHVLLEETICQSIDFYSGYHASIDAGKCIQCSKCRAVCHFGAISESFQVDKMTCEGCGYCSFVCPQQAITLHEAYSGQVFLSRTRFDSMLVHARLEIAGENSGKLVTEVKDRARELASAFDCDLILYDGSPGIGCPVIASLTRASIIVMVTEPSVSGYNDMVRLYKLITRFHIPCAIILNKSDLNESHRKKIVRFSVVNEIPILGEIPYDPLFTEALMQRKTILEVSQNGISGSVNTIWNRLKSMII